MSGWIIMPVFLPVLAGCFLLIASFLEHLRAAKKRRAIEGEIRIIEKNQGRFVHGIAVAVLLISAGSALTAAWTGDKSVTLFYLMEDIPIYFQIDALGRLFVTVLSIIWIAVGVYAVVYMTHEGEEKRFFGFYLLLYGVLVALDFSGNLVTMYLFYELLTLCSMPLVLHSGSKEAIMAALKYVFYSICGAYLALFGIFFLYRYCYTLTFVPGGSLDVVMLQGKEQIFLIAVFAMVLGFGAKAGMLPLHAWLPTAHPVAPTPASAVLSGIIVKSGVLAVIRAIYYVVGVDMIRETWVQTAWIVLTLLTIFMGSLLAYREPVLKKRLAYSTVSQVSYILFGLSLFNLQGMMGALLHTVFHAVIKSGLFLVAGVFWFQDGKKRVDQLPGIGKKMPCTLWCYTLLSLALIGIPPASGFMSKWYLAQGALEANIGALRWIGPVVLLISAFLTAGYLLPVTMKGFFPGKNEEINEAGKEPTKGMLLPVLILAALSFLLGAFPNLLLRYVGGIASMIFK